MQMATAVVPKSERWLKLCRRVLCVNIMRVHYESLLSMESNLYHIVLSCFSIFNETYRIINIAYCVTLHILFPEQLI